MIYFIKGLTLLGFLVLYVTLGAAMQKYELIISAPWWSAYGAVWGIAGYHLMAWAIDPARGGK